MTRLAQGPTIHTRTHRACGISKNCYFLQTRKFRERASVIWNRLRIQIMER